MVVLHTAIAIAVIVLLIIKIKVDPVISLIIGSLYLGLATGVGFTATLTAIATGFGEIMGEVGLLIGFGVLIGAMLHAIGAFRKMVTMLVDRVAAHVRCARDRDLRRLRFRDPGTGRGLHRGLARDSARHVADLRLRAGAVDRDRDDIDLPVASPRPLLERGQGRTC